MVALLRSLPKALRVSFVPAPNHAKAFLAAVSPGEEPLLDALERHLRATTGVVVPREAWDWSKVPGASAADVPGARRRRLGASRTGKDLGALKKPLEASFARAMASAAGATSTVTGQTAWTFGTIEQTFTQTRAGHEVVGYPGARRRGRRPSGLRVFGSAAERDASHRLGVRRLVALSRGVAGQAHRGRVQQRRQADPRRLAVPDRRRRCSTTASWLPSTRLVRDRSGTRPGSSAVARLPHPGDDDARGARPRWCGSSRRGGRRTAR